jgi:phosphoglucosamine mutase
MTAEMAMSLGRALTYLLGVEKKLSRKPKVVVGQDTRISGDLLSNAVAAGVMSQGGDVYMADILPTPGLANLTASTRADAGFVISASHNPFQDNGLKIFDGQGYKLPDEVEARLESLMLDKDLLDSALSKSESVGRTWRIEDSLGRYVVALKSTFPKSMDLEGIKIVLDCANGAAYRSAPAVFEELGAQVYLLGVNPNGFNINRDLGALYPEVCAEKVLETGADLGVALDGDADRAIFINNRGEVVDGDQIMFLCALHLKKINSLTKNTIAATVMSNMGLELALEKEGVRMIRTNVGDRYVAECLRREQLNFGGEKSGHLIFLDHATTGDGSLAALQTLAVMKTTSRPLRELAGSVDLFPQVLLNVPVAKPRELYSSPEINDQVEGVKLLLGRRGRVLLRPSGTEPVVRVMVEGEDKALIETLAKESARVVYKALN